jgi:hypothetical protein
MEADRLPSPSQIRDLRVKNSVVVAKTLIGLRTCEAIDDKAARDLITDALDLSIDLEKIKKVKKLKIHAETYLESFLKEWDPRELLEGLYNM